MKKALIFFVASTFAIYGAENKNGQNLAVLIEEIINAHNPTPTDYFTNADFKKESNTLANKALRSIDEYQKLNKKYPNPSDKKKLLLLRYQNTDTLIEILLYTQALLELLDRKNGRKEDENLSNARDNLYNRKVRLANDYDVFNSKTKLSQQQLSLGLQKIDTLFIDTKTHLEKVQDLIKQYLAKLTI